MLKLWIPIFNTAKDTPLDGSQFDYLFNDGEIFKLGNTDVKCFTQQGTPLLAAAI